MSWTTRGSISERLRALKVRDDILLKQQGMMAPSDPLSVSTEQQQLQGVQDVQQPNSEMPLGAGQGDYSGIGQAINSSIDGMDSMIESLTTAEVAISAQGRAGVTTNSLAPISMELHTIMGDLKKTKFDLMATHEKFNAITSNDPTESMTPTGNARLEAGTASPILSQQGNASRLGVY